MLEIHLLGHFQVRLNSRLVEIPERPAQSLFAYLSLNAGIEHRRERLAGMLWPETTEANARKYLRHALWRIRKSLTDAGGDPDEFIQVSEISLAFRQGADFWLDAHELLETTEPRELDEERLANIVGLYRSELLPGFYEEWTSLERERLRARFQQLIQVLLDRLISQERWQEAQEWGERWIALGEVPEPAYRAVMVARAAAGDRSGAVATYQRAVEDLERELGLDPSSEFRSAFEEVTRETGRPSKRNERLREATGRLRGELRPVTILDVELTGLHSQSAVTDLEAFKELLDASMGALVQEVLQHEGTVVRVQKEGLLSFFGAPVAHEDDTARALSAALAIRKRFSRAEDHSFPISPRIGLEAGEILVGNVGWDLRLGYTAVGEAIDIASLLVRSGQGNDVLVGESAYEESIGRFEFAPRQRLEVAGEVESVGAYPLLRARDVPASPPTDPPKVDLLVGREAELTTLLDMVDKPPSSGGQAVLVLGEPGIGKSRLLNELKNRRSDVRWASGQSLTYGVNLAYHPVMEAVRDLLGVREGEPRDLLVERLTGALQQLPDERRTRFVSYLCTLLSPGQVGENRPFTVEIVTTQLAEAVIALLREFGQEQPTVVAFDDLQWADTATVDLIHEILSQLESLPVLFVLAFRPDHEVPSWKLHEQLLSQASPGIREIHLKPFSEAVTGELLDAFAPLPSPVRDLLVRRSGGNPFFLEELARALIDEGTVVREDSRWVVAGEIEYTQVPTTVQKVILARADRLPEIERWVLQAASVLGWSFHKSVLEKVSEEAVEKPLLALQKADFVFLQAKQPEPEYVFRHWLIRDAIYTTLLKSDRRRLHRRAGEALESFSGKRVRQYAGLLAYHYILAEEPAKALEHAATAAEMAYRTAAPLEAAQTFLMALDQHPPPDLALRLYVGLARAYASAVQMEACLDAYDQAIHVARGLGDYSTMAECMAQSAMVRWQLTEDRETRRLFLEAAIGELADTPDSAGKVLLLAEAARQFLVVGDLDSARRQLGEARHGLSSSNHDKASLESHLLNTEGLLALREGTFEAGLRLLVEAQKLALESGEMVATSRSQTNLSTTMIDVFGRIEEGLTGIEATRQALASHGNWAAFVEETVHLARARWGEGRMTDGLTEIEFMATKMRGQPTWLPWAGAKAPLLGALGHTEEALSAARRAWQATRRTGDELMIRHAGLWIGRALGYSGEFEDATSYLWLAAEAAAAAPALQAEIMAEWMYAVRSSSETDEVDDAVQLLTEIPELSPYVTAWKRIGLALASMDPADLQEATDYLEGIGQEYVAWLYRLRAANLIPDGNSVALRKSAEAWAAERELDLY